MVVRYPRDDLAAERQKRSVVDGLFQEGGEIPGPLQQRRDLDDAVVPAGEVRPHARPGPIFRPRRQAGALSTRGKGNAATRRSTEEAVLANPAVRRPTQEPKVQS